MLRKSIIGIIITIVGLALATWHFFYKTVESQLDVPTKLLFDALERKDSSGVREAISLGADPNLKVLGRPLILEGAKEGDLFLVQILIENGADVNIRSAWGRTPLHEAALYGRKEVVDLLLLHGAHVNAKNPRGETPLFYAEEGLAVGPQRTDEHKEVARILREHGGKKYPTPLSQQALAKLASELNRNLPVLVDQETEITATAGLPGVFVYNYRLVNRTAGSLDKEKLLSHLQSQNKNGACSTPETRDTFLRNGVTLRYRYYDKDNVFIGSVNVSPSDCGF